MGGTITFLPFFGVLMEGQLTGKKLRKPYTITRPRDRWTSEEHDRFLEALLIFGRDWKKIEDFVGTKTTIQIRSHAQKYFLKIQKIGLAAHVPPPHSKRKVGPHHQPRSSSTNDVLQSRAPIPLPMGPTSFMNPCNTWDPPSTCTSSNNSIYYTPNDARALTDCFSVVPQIIDGEGDPMGLGTANLYDQNLNWVPNSSQTCLNNYVPDPSISNPLPSLPVAPNFSQVCSFIGNMFDPETTRPLQVYYEKLQQFDPATMQTILIIIRNLTTNLLKPNFESLVSYAISSPKFPVIDLCVGRWLSTYNSQTETIGVYNNALSPPLIDGRWEQEYQGCTSRKQFH